MSSYLCDSWLTYEKILVPIFLKGMERDTAFKLLSTKVGDEDAEQIIDDLLNHKILILSEGNLCLHYKVIIEIEESRTFWQKVGIVFRSIMNSIAIRVNYLWGFIRKFFAGLWELTPLLLTIVVIVGSIAGTFAGEEQLETLFYSWANVVHNICLTVTILVCVCLIGWLHS